MQAKILYTTDDVHTRDKMEAGVVEAESRQAAETVKCLSKYTSLSCVVVITGVCVCLLNI